MSRWPCKDYFKGTCTTPFCEKWHPPQCLFWKSENGCRFGEKCSCAHRQVDEHPSKRSKKNGDKRAVAMLKITRQLGCVFQDVEPPKSSSMLRKSSNIRKPIRCVQFTKAVVPHANIRDQNLSLGMTCPGDPHQRSPNAPKYKDQSQEETEWQERCARAAAWKLAKSISKLKEHERATFFSPSENRCLPASNHKLEEREFVVDPGASMHMISEKDLNSAEMDTLTTSRSLAIVITANDEEATVYVSGKLRDENGHSYEWIHDQKSHLIKTGFGYLVTRRTSFLLWFQACQVRLQDLIRQLQGHLQDKRIIATSSSSSSRGDPTFTKPIKFQNQMKRNPRGNGVTRCLPIQVVQALKSRSGCKKSGKMWWMMKFQNMDILTPVL